jgi:putative membrane protein
MSSLLLVALSRGGADLISFVPALAVFVLSGLAISSALHVIDKKTIATFRRAQALILAGEIIWLMAAALGALCAWFTKSSYQLTNAFLFGAFACAGLEFIIINGAFVRSAPLSLALAVLHPTATLLVVRLPELMGHFDPIATTCGVLVLALFIGFPLLLKRRKTSLGHDALDLFQAFMKTWTAGDSADLEGIIADHSEEVEVTTKVLRFGSKSGDIFLVFPGVHPGPFHPVGSYDLPGVVSNSFKDLGHVLTLHRPGGHERNLATRAETTKYVLTVVELAKSIAPDERRAVLRGPISSEVGKATVSASVFSDDMVLTISFAPLGSDDLDTRVESELAAPASASGFKLSVVDAHNSIDQHPLSPALDDPGWRRIFETASNAKPDHYSVSYAHSSELGFEGRGDLTENGIGLFMLQKGGNRSVLVLADANNSVPNLRSEVAERLSAAGYDLIEFCTSDSHNLAARGLTVTRGYQALGEVTPTSSITDAVVRMAKLAESRLAPAGYGSAQMASRVRVLGSRALEEFAAITQASSRFSSTYLRYAVAAVTALFLMSIVF